MATMKALISESPRLDATVMVVSTPPLVNVMLPPEKKLAVPLYPCNPTTTISASDGTVIVVETVPALELSLGENSRTEPVWTIAMSALGIVPMNRLAVPHVDVALEPPAALVAVEKGRSRVVSQVVGARKPVLARSRREPSAVNEADAP